MSTFEALKLAYLRSTGKDEPGVLALLAFGSVSGSVGATSVYPLNLVRTRLQASGSSGHPQRYKGPWDVVTQTYQRDGWRGFYRGLFPTLAKVYYCGLRCSHQANHYHRSFLQSLYHTLSMNIASEGTFF
jgi:solute carrier family 25 phosphate transporter 23/24/25/41